MALGIVAAALFRTRSRSLVILAFHPALKLALVEIDANRISYRDVGRPAQKLTLSRPCKAIATP